MFQESLERQIAQDQFSIAPSVQAFLNLRQALPGNTLLQTDGGFADRTAVMIGWAAIYHIDPDFIAFHTDVAPRTYFDIPINWIEHIEVLGEPRFDGYNLVRLSLKPIERTSSRLSPLESRCSTLKPDYRIWSTSGTCGYPSPEKATATDGGAEAGWNDRGAMRVRSDLLEDRSYSHYSMAQCCGVGTTFEDLSPRRRTRIDAYVKFDGISGQGYARYCKPVFNDLRLSFRQFLFCSLLQLQGGAWVELAHQEKEVAWFSKDYDRLDNIGITSKSWGPPSPTETIYLYLSRQNVQPSDRFQIRSGIKVVCDYRQDGANGFVSHANALSVGDMEMELTLRS